MTDLNTFSLRVRQNDIHAPYSPTNSVCEGSDPHYLKSEHNLDANPVKVCYKLNENTCPKLGGALSGMDWGNDSPNVNCTYSLDKITTDEQVLEYIRLFGKDRYYDEVLMPKVFTWTSTKCPQNVDGRPHKECLKVLESSPVGKLLREWSSRNPKRADLLALEYSSQTGNSDCQCISRKDNPVYEGMYNHSQMKNVAPGQWFVPCTDDTRFLIPSEIKTDVRNAKPASKRVAAAANYFFRRSNDKPAFYEAINMYSSVDVKWRGRKVRRMQAEQTITQNTKPDVSVLADDEGVVRFGSTNATSTNCDDDICEVSVLGEDDSDSDSDSKETTKNNTFDITHTEDSSIDNYRYQRYGHTSGGNGKSLWLIIIPIVVLIIIGIVIAIAVSSSNKNRKVVDVY